VRRDISGVGKIVDVRRFVSDIRLGDDALAASVRRAGLIGRVVVLDAHVAITPTGSAKAAEVVEALTGDRACPWSAVRVELTGAGASPLELEAHRRKPAQSTADAVLVAPAE